MAVAELRRNQILSPQDATGVLPKLRLQCAQTEVTVILRFIDLITGVTPAQSFRAALRLRAIGKIGSKRNVHQRERTISHRDVHHLPFARTLERLKSQQYADD